MTETLARKISGTLYRVPSLRLSAVDCAASAMMLRRNAIRVRMSAVPSRSSSQVCRRFTPNHPSIAVPRGLGLAWSVAVAAATAASQADAPRTLARRETRSWARPTTVVWCGLPVGAAALSNPHASERSRPTLEWLLGQGAQPRRSGRAPVGSSTCDVGSGLCRCGSRDVPATMLRRRFATGARRRGRTGGSWSFRADRDCQRSAVVFGGGLRSRLQCTSSAVERSTELDVLSPSSPRLCPHESPRRGRTMMRADGWHMCTMRWTGPC